jgi:hypothetical protein
MNSSVQFERIVLSERPVVAHDERRTGGER